MAALFHNNTVMQSKNIQEINLKRQLTNKTQLNNVVLNK